MSVPRDELKALVKEFSSTPYYSPMAHRDEAEAMGETHGYALAAVLAFKKATEYLATAEKQELAKWLEGRWVAMNSDEYRAAQKGHSIMQRDVASGGCGQFGGLAEWLVKRVG